MSEQMNTILVIATIVCAFAFLLWRGLRGYRKNGCCGDCCDVSHGKGSGKIGSSDKRASGA